MPFFIIIPRKTDLHNFVPPENTVVTYKTGATFNEDLIVEYIRRVVLPYKNHWGYETIYFIIDHAKCHLTASVRSYCSTNSIELVYIPKRLTNILQPADVMWFRSFKRNYNQLWTEWFMSGNHDFTVNKNLKSPGYSKCIEWLSQIWLEFNITLLRESFDKCGITSSDSLHSVLAQMLAEKEVYSDVLEDAEEHDQIDGFDPDNDWDIFEDFDLDDFDELEAEIDAGMESDTESEMETETNDEIPTIDKTLQSFKRSKLLKRLLLSIK